MPSVYQDSNGRHSCLEGTSPATVQSKNARHGTSRKDTSVAAPAVAKRNDAPGRPSTKRPAAAEKPARAAKSGHPGQAEAAARPGVRHRGRSRKPETYRAGGFRQPHKIPATGASPSVWRLGTQAVFVQAFPSFPGHSPFHAFTLLYRHLSHKREGFRI